MMNRQNVQQVQSEDFLQFLEAQSQEMNQLTKSNQCKQTKKVEEKAKTNKKDISKSNQVKQEILVPEPIKIKRTRRTEEKRDQLLEVLDSFEKGIDRYFDCFENPDQDLNKLPNSQKSNRKKSSRPSERETNKFLGLEDPSPKELKLPQRKNRNKRRIKEEDPEI